MRTLMKYGLAASLLLSAACASNLASQQTQDASWIARPAIYELFVRDFSPAGNLQGVIDGLDRIQASGANVIWLMPIHPIGTVNRKGTLGSPYSIVDYRAINPDFGTHADFKRLVDAVHARGMKLILDFVPNHTAFDHVWVKSHPNRYTRTATGEISTAIDNEGKATDWTDVADLNYNNPDTRQAIIADMKYWLDEFGIDGYRVDVAGFIADDFWRYAVPALRADRKPILMLAEWGDLKFHTFGFDLTYGWPNYAKLKEVWKGAPASAFIESELAEAQQMPEGGRRLRFTTNHDETAWDKPAVVLFSGSAGARAAFIAQTFMPGVPLLYNGQEVESPQTLRLFERDPVEWNQPGAADALRFYRSVLDLQRTHPAFANNAFQDVAIDAEADVIAYRRGNAVVLVNVRDRAVTANVTGISLSGAKALLSTARLNGNAVALPAYGYAVLELSGS